MVPFAFVVVVFVPTDVGKEKRDSIVNNLIPSLASREIHEKPSPLLCLLAASVWEAS